MLNRRVVRALKKLQLDTYVKASVLPLILGEYSSKKREQQQEAGTAARSKNSSKKQQQQEARTAARSKNSSKKQQEVRTAARSKNSSNSNSKNSSKNSSKDCSKNSSKNSSNSTILIGRSGVAAKLYGYLLVAY